jgi:abortive infection bacteriophage resistance protein
MKEYKSNEELLNHLISKGVTIKNRQIALDNIEKYTYYSIVNTYKEVFKNNDKYLDNVTFEEIYSLYDFDKNLKSIFLKYTLEIEQVIKSFIANTVSEKYGVKDYLKYDCFDASADKDSINNMILSIDEEINKNYGKHAAINHYKDTYGFIPPFVLVKIMTMGQISRYYGLLKQEDRQRISKYFKISDKLLKQILLNITLVRNFSAHNNRLYTFHSKFFISFKSIDKTYNTSDRSTNLYMIMKCMERLLDDNKRKQFIEQVNKEINDLDKKLNVISIKTILNIMGFPNE